MTLREQIDLVGLFGFRFGAHTVELAFIEIALGLCLGGVFQIIFNLGAIAFDNLFGLFTWSASSIATRIAAWFAVMNGLAD